jgi:hypothetical protein
MEKLNHHDYINNQRAALSSEDSHNKSKQCLNIPLAPPNEDKSEDDFITTSNNLVIRKIQTVCSAARLGFRENLGQVHTSKVGSIQLGQVKENQMKESRKKELVCEVRNLPVMKIISSQNRAQLGLVHESNQSDPCY